MKSLDFGHAFDLGHAPPMPAGHDTLPRTDTERNDQENAWLFPACQVSERVTRLEHGDGVASARRPHRWLGCWFPFRPAFRPVLGMLVFVAMAATLVGLPAMALGAPTLTADGDPHGGFVTLSWGERHALVQLQEATSPDFRDADLRYEGRHTSTVISGLTDGTYYYRVREKGADGTWSAWSEAVSFAVEHYSLAFAGSLFGVGAFVFATTVIFVVRAREDV